MPLARRPDLALAVGVDAGDRGVRLDVGLVDRRGLELLLDDHVGLGKAGVEIADREFEPLGNVGGLGRRRLDAASDHVLEQERRIGLHRLVDIDDVRQDLIVDLDECCRLFGRAAVGRRDGGDRVALVERLLARHDVAGDVPEILRDPLRPDILEFMVGKIGGGHHRLDAGQRQSPRGVDRADAGMGMRRANDLAVERPGHRQIGAVHRAARDLRHAVRANRPRPNPLVARRCDIVHGCSPHRPVRFSE